MNSKSKKLVLSERGDNTIIGILWYNYHIESVLLPRGKNLGIKWIEV